MPLSPSDVQFMNNLLDRHLKNQRSWPWARYCSIAGAAFLILAGFYSLWMADNLPQFPFVPTTTTRSIPSSTRPVTEDVFLRLNETSDQLALAAARFEAEMATTRLALVIGGALQIFFGCYWISLTLVRWNQHRRDRILITLLREKCGKELAPPS